MKKGFPRAKTDPEFLRLVPDLSHTEYEALAIQIEKEKRPGMIAVWDGVLIMGLEDYKLCRQYHVPYTLEHLMFANREEAMAWVCRQQLLRTDLTNIWRRFLIGAQSWYSTRSLTHLKRTPDYQKTVVDIAEQYRITPRTIYVYRALAQALFEIEEKAPQMFHYILSGDRYFSMDEIRALSNMNREEVRDFAQQMAAGEQVVIPLRRIHGRRRYQPPSTLAKRPNVILQPPKEEPAHTRQEATVKKMPSYNPDAVVNQLALTIPTWIQSIRRAQEKTDLQAVSQPARENLWRVLEDMRAAVLSTQEWVRKET